jgi:hypothetical protein
MIGTFSSCFIANRSKPILLMLDEPAGNFLKIQCFTNNLGRIFFLKLRSIEDVSPRTQDE